jgi:hypothetical protein
VKNNSVNYADPSGLYWGEDLVDGVVDGAGDAAGAVVDNATDVLDSVATDENILFLDQMAVNVTIVAVAVTDTSLLMGCAVGGIGCGAGYLAGVAATQPLNGLADTLGIASWFLGCYANGWNGDCLHNGALTAAGTLIPEPHVDLINDLVIVKRDLDSQSAEPQVCP